MKKLLVASAVAGSSFALLLVTVNQSLGAQLFPWSPAPAQPVITETSPPIVVTETLPPTVAEQCAAAKTACINGCYSTLTQCTWNSAQVHAACILAVQNRLPGPYPTDPSEAIRLCEEARETTAANCHLAKDNCIRGC